MTTSFLGKVQPSCLGPDLPQTKRSIGTGDGSLSDHNDDTDLDVHSSIQQ